MKLRILGTTVPAILVLFQASEASTQTCQGTTVPGIRAVPYTGAGLPPKVLSLTYDDGPSRPTTTTTRRIAEYLRDQGIRATFFSVTGAHHNPCVCPPGSDGTCASSTEGVETPDLSVFTSLVASGHRIANHTHNHRVLTQEFPAGVRQQVCQTQRLIDQHVSDGIFLFRPPGGTWDDAAATPSVALTSDPSFNRIVGPVNWTFPLAGRSYDWPCARVGSSPSQCSNEYLAQLDENPNLGGIMLFHDWIWRGATYGTPACAMDTGSTWAAELAEYLVPQLRQRGYLILPLEADKELPGGLLFNKLDTHPWSSNFSNADGFHWNEGYYGTFRLGDITGDGRSDLCARGINGIYCNISNGTAFPGGYALWQGAFSDASGWFPTQYSLTIQLGDINGDSRSDICGLRPTPHGVVCALSNGLSGFGPMTTWLSDPFLQGTLFTNIGYYGTVRLGDVTRDGKADLCFRRPDGFYCAVSSGTSFASPTRWTTAYNDSNGWLPAQYSTTIQLGDINGDGRSDVCARHADGLYCATADAAANTASFTSPAYWSAGTTYRNFSDWDGFGSSSGYYRTFRLGDVDGDQKADACIRSMAGVLCAKSTGNRFEAYRVWQKVDFRDDMGWLPDPYSATVMLGDVTGSVNGVSKADFCARGYGGVVCASAK